MKKIRNKIKWNNYGEIIESTDCHEFVMCKYGRCFVDGGLDYLRRSFTDSEDAFEILSIFGESRIKN